MATTVVEFTTPMSEKELKAAIGQAVSSITEQCNVIGRQIAQADSFSWVKHPFNNITYEDKQVGKPVSSIPYHTTYDFQFRIVDGKIQQYAEIRMSRTVCGQVKGDAMTLDEMTDDLKIDGIKFDKTRSRQGKVSMDFTGESHTFVFFVAVKDGLTFDTPDDLRHAYTTYGRKEASVPGLRGDFRKLDSARAFAHHINRIKQQHDITAVSDENTLKAITLLYEERKANA